MAEVDSLEIKIQSDSRLAITSLNTLIEKLKDVSKALGSINTSALSASAKELTGKLSAINGKGFSDLNRSAKEAEATVKKASDTAKKGIKSKISFDTKDYQTVIDNLNKKFANAGKGFKARDTLVQMQKQADALSARLEKLLQKEDKIVSVGKMSPESSVFQNLQYDINAIMNNLDTLYRKMGQLPQKTKELSNINIHRWNENQNVSGVLKQPRTVKIPASSMGYNKEAVAGVEAIYQKMYGDAEKAAQKTDSLGNRVEALKAKLKELSGQGLNFGDEKFDETYRKLNQANEELKKHKSNLEQTGNTGKSFSERIKNALSGVSSQTNKTSGNMGKLSSSIKKALHSVKQSSDGFGGFAKKIGLLYAKLYVLRRGFNALFGTVKSSMDYIETLNYFNAAFGQIAKKADLKSFKEMGYDSAEEYYNSFSERAEKLTQKMSGFKIEESGMAVSTGEKSLGIDPGILMQNQAMFGQMSNSMGIASETATNLSSIFTRLGADIASLKNEDFQKVWQNMASGTTGMSRAVDKYGMNIREANLQQTLSNIGISTSISKLTQQEKVLLRTIVMLDSSRAAWGDLAKTMNQPANQLRLLQSNWNNLSRTIGNIFLPIVAKVLPYLNAVTIVLQRFAEQIVKLLGFEDFNWGGLGATGGADLDIDFGDAEDDTAGIADNMDKTAKKTKKAVDNTQGFDILNKLQDTDSDKDQDKDDVKGLSPSEAGKLTGALDKLLSDYDKAWNKAFKGMENKANELANKMQKALADAWGKGDFSKFGSAIAKWINKGLAKIPWNKIKKTVKNTAKSIATFFNGFIKDLDWSLVGKTLAEGLNTIIDGAYTFWTTFDWLKFGKSLSTGVNSFINKFDAKKFGKLFGSKLRGIIQLAFGLLANLDYKKLGKKFGDAINGFFEDMGKVRKNTGLTGWQELGQTISKSITGILDTINTALSTVKWEEVGKTIADFLTSIDWWGILGKLLTVLGNTLSAIVKTAISAIAENPARMIKALTGAFALIFTVKKLMVGFSFLTTAFKKVFRENISKGLVDAASSANIGGASKTLTKRFNVLGSTLGRAMGVAMIAAYGFWENKITAGGNASDVTKKYISGTDQKSQLLAQLQSITDSLGLGGTTREASIIAQVSKKLESGEIKSEKLEKILGKTYKSVTESEKRQSIIDLIGDLGVTGVNVATGQKDKKGFGLYKAFDIKETTKYKKSVKELSMAMKKLGINSENAKKIQNNLARSLDNNEISWKDYKKIVDGNYDSVEDLKSAIKRLFPKSVKVDADVSGKKDVEDTKNAIDGTKSKDVHIGATTDLPSIKEFKSAVNGISGKTVNIGASFNTKKFKNMLNNPFYANIQPIASSLKKGINSVLSKNNWSIKISTDINKKMGISANMKLAEANSKLGMLSTRRYKLEGDTFKIPKELVPTKAGKDLIKWATEHGYKWKKYKYGGFPERGQLFWANEAGPELVGNMNGRTAVAPQNDIAEGFAQAITNTLAPVMYAAFKQAASETAQTNGGDVYLDGKKITENVIGHVNQISKQRGNKPIWGMN